MLITKPAILDVLLVKDYAVFDGDNYDLNIIGIRSKNSVAGEFDDLIVVVYKVNGEWFQECFKCTTDPGVYWLLDKKKKGNKKGTAVLVPGQYRGCWIIDYHSGRYKALCQRTGDVKVYRDANKDNIIDKDKSTIDEGLFGVNIHRAHSKYELDTVGAYSAGCTVIQRPEDFDRFMWLAHQQIKHNPTFTKFSYTLIDE